MRIVAVTQARSGSSRLPGKVLLKIGKDSLLGLHIQRILKSKTIDKLILATTIAPEDSAIEEIGAQYNVTCCKGSVEDVLDRFYQAMQNQSADYVVRLTSDCPLIDPLLIDQIVRYTIDHNLDYCSNTLDPTYPDGQDVEVFKFSALVRAWNEAKLLSEREHVTPYIWSNSSFKGGKLFKSDNFSEGKSYGHLRMTVDERSDFEVIRHIITDIGNDCSWLQYAEYLETNKIVKEINGSITRNEGYSKSLNQDNNE